MGRRRRGAKEGNGKTCGRGESVKGGGVGRERGAGGVDCAITNGGGGGSKARWEERSYWGESRDAVGAGGSGDQVWVQAGMEVSGRKG